MKIKIKQLEVVESKISCVVKKSPNHEISNEQLENSFFSESNVGSQKTYELFDDSILVEMICAQNELACSELYERYRKKLFTYIFHLVGNRDESEDILQAVFLKTFKNIEHFDRTRKFSSWIYRIAHNEAVNFLKRKSKRYMVSWEDVSTSKDKLGISTTDESFEDKWMQEEISKEIREALEKIPQKYQHVLQLRYFKEHSYEDISNILNKPVNTVGTLINRAKKKLLETVQQQTIIN